MNNRRIRKNSSSGFVRGKMLTGILIVGGIVLGCVIAFFLISDSVDPETIPRPVIQLSAAERIRLQARELLRVGQQQRAIALLEKYKDSHPEDISTNLMLVNIYLENNMVQKGEELLDKTLAMAPNNPDALWLKGTINIALARDENGWDYLTKAANQPDTTAGILGGYGVLLTQKGRFDEAENYLQRAVDGGSKEPQILLALGYVKFERGKYDEALNYTTLSTKYDSENPKAWMLLSEIQRNVSKNKEALESLRRARKVSQGPTRGFIDAKLGEMFALNKQWLLAANHYSKAVEFPELELGKEKPAFNAATCYYHAGEFAKAMRHIDQAEQLTPGDKYVAEWKKKIEDARFGTPKGNDSHSNL